MGNELHNRNYNNEQKDHLIFTYSLYALVQYKRFRISQIHLHFREMCQLNIYQPGDEVKQVETVSNMSASLE